MDLPNRDTPEPGAADTPSHLTPSRSTRPAHESHMALAVDNPKPDTRMRIMLAAEQLFAQKGFDAVSLREVNLAAGQRNKSAVHYHFRDRNTLIHDLLEYRLATIDARRNAMLEDLRNHELHRDMRSLVGAYVMPLAEIASDGRTYYLRFLARFMTWNHSEVDMLFVGSSKRSADRTRGMIEACLTTLPEWLRRLRVEQMAQYVVCMLAFAEDQRSRRADLGAPYEVWIAELIETSIAILSCEQAGSGNATAAKEKMSEMQGATWQP